MKLRKSYQKGKEDSAYTVEGERVDILSENWDILVILDACRYDYFNDIYTNYFNESECRKAVSPVTRTKDWFRRIFGSGSYDDIVYVSANPMIRKYTTDYNSIDYNLGAKFHKIVDVWKHRWNEELDTVHPSQVNNMFHRAYLKYPNKRFIVHYMQPHDPYIYIGGMKNLDEHTELFDVFDVRDKYIKVFTKIMKIILRRKWGILWNIYDAFGLVPRQPMGKTWQKYGNNALRYLYKKNLEIVLEHLKRLVDTISVNWLITSDHGERLGENLAYIHGGPRDKEVIEVPWLFIQNG